jgi:hypothetical protein
MNSDILFEKLLNEISKYNPNFDSELIKRVYVFAKKAHK